MDIFWPTLEVKGTFSLLCSILYMTVGPFLLSNIVKFPWLTPIHADVLFWSKMSAIFTQKVHKHCLHACSFLQVWQHHQRKCFINQPAVQITDWKVAWHRLNNGRSIEENCPKGNLTKWQYNPSSLRAWSQKKRKKNDMHIRDSSLSRLQWDTNRIRQWK